MRWREIKDEKKQSKITEMDQKKEDEEGEV
jgi:hypothetical protein